MIDGISRWWRNGISALAVICLAGCNLSISSEDIFDPAPATLSELEPMIGFVDQQIQTSIGPIGIRTSSGLGSRSGSGTIAVLLHGNAGNVSTEPWRGLTSKLAQTGMDVVAIDYPGFGLSPGEPTLAKMARSVAAVLDALQQSSRVQADDKLVLYGASLGSYPAIQTALTDRDGQRWSVDGLILDSPVSSSADMVDHVKANRFGGALIRVQVGSEATFDNAQAAAGLRIPVLLIHGQEDEALPPSMSRKIAQELTVRHQFWLVPEAVHVNTHEIAPKDFQRRVTEFVNSL